MPLREEEMEFRSLDGFTKYVEKEIQPATVDIKSLPEKSRVHIQKLVYTNLVDRFDTIIDQMILDNCREDYFVEEALKDGSSSISEAELYRLLLNSDGLQDALRLRLQAGLRNSVLRGRHSQKLMTLLQLSVPQTNAHKPVPRVNLNNGEILEKLKPQKRPVPQSIVGYADWLYARRNAIVHGAGSRSLLKNDVSQIKRLFQVEVAGSFKIIVGSITSAATFYRRVASILKEGSI
jgi:hypothetical protein